MRIYNKHKKSHSSALPQENIITSYEEFWNIYKQDLGHYFRYLYRIFKYVDDSFLDDTKKKLYTSIARAQLSDNELILIFYNCLAIYGSEKFKPLAERYGLFDNMPLEELFDHDHVDLFDQSAYK